MTELESAKEIVKQRGGCIDIHCSDCCLSTRNCGGSDIERTLQLAKEYLEKHTPKNKMTKLESAKIIVEQKGSCMGIQCSDCCLSPNDCNNRVDNFKLAKEYLEKHTPKNKITKLESAKEIVKQNGCCGGIDCKNCCLVSDCDIRNNLKLAKEYLEKHETKNMVLVSNDKVHWKKRELVTIYDNHFLCRTKDGGYKIWRCMKEITKTETWYQYLFKTTMGVFAVTPHISLKEINPERYTRIDESAKEVEV